MYFRFKYLFQPLGTYSVSKTTLLGLTRAIANEVVHDNIRVNCVAPGIVATKFASAVSTYTCVIIQPKSL